MLQARTLEAERTRQMATAEAAASSDRQMMDMQHAHQGQIHASEQKAMEEVSAV